MANNQLLTSNKYQQLDCNYNSSYYSNNNNNINNNNNNNVTLNRLVSKFGDIVAPKNMRNLQNANITLGFPADPLKPASVNIHSLSEQIEFLNSTSSIDENEDTINSVSLAQSIETTLKDARTQDVDSGSGQGEILIPSDLSSRVADDIVRMAEDEPCGLRGCIIYINVEEKSAACNNSNVRRLGKVRCDSTAVPTFEVTLNLRQDSSWLRLLPLKGCWKKLKNKAVIVSSCYSLTKNKLYRSNQ